jgi:hypothetical protein
VNAPAKIGPVYHEEFEQGSGLWLKARCGLLTASEFDRILAIEPARTVKMYRAADGTPEKLTAKQSDALAAIDGAQGSVAELAALAECSDGLIRALKKAGAIEQCEVHVPMTTKVPPEPRERAHLWEIAAQRISQYVEPTYIGDKMLRGHEDEIRARELYAKHFAPVEQVGFVTNSKWGFTLGCSPDGLVGDDGLIECKSRDQKFQVQTICEWQESGKVPDEFMLQIQGQLLITERSWCDFISYSGGLPTFPMRVEADETVQSAIVDAAAKFEARINEAVATFAEATSNAIPTERVIEEEMYL